MALVIPHGDGPFRAAKFHVCVALPAGGQWFDPRFRSAGAVRLPRRAGSALPLAKRCLLEVPRLLPGVPPPRSHQDGGAPGRPPLPNVAIVKTHAGVAGGGGSPRATEGVEPLHAIVNNGSVGRRDLTTGCSPTGVPVLILSSTLGADGKRFAAHGCNQDRPATQSRVLARCEVVPSSVELRWRPVIVRLRGWPHHGGCCRIGCVLWEWWAGRCSTGPAQAGAARWILRRLNAVAARWASLRAAVRPRRENRSSSFLKFPIPGSAVAPRRV